MRLHTDFHDYYDNAVGFGIDENVHYNRFTKKVEIRIKLQFDFPNHNYAGLLGFCGEIYPFIELRKYGWEYDKETDSVKSKIVERYYAYNIEEYKNKKSEWYEFKNLLPDYYDYSRDLDLKRFFSDWNYQSDDIFIKNKVPVWTLELDRNRNESLINPRLKDYGFDRIKYSFTAFQEISMYLSNILVEQKEIAVIEDKYRIEQHGFDLKKSFRKNKNQ